MPPQDNKQWPLYKSPGQNIFRVTDPDACTIYDRSEAQLQEFLIFCICVAGKNAKTVQKSLQKFWYDITLDTNSESSPPFQILNRWVALFDSLRVGPGALADKMKECGIGCHKTKSRGLLAISIATNLCLHTCTAEELEQFPGIGPKTSRYFILHSRKDAKVACLDVHILRYMREKRKIRGVPLHTPQSMKKYKELEKTFLSLVPRGQTPAEFDLKLWRIATQKKH